MDLSHPVEDVVVAFAHRDWIAPPTQLTGRREPRGRDSITYRIWVEGPMPMETLEALLMRRLRTE